MRSLLGNYREWEPCFWRVPSGAARRRASVWPRAYFTYCGNQVFLSSTWSVVCDWKYGVKLAVVDKTLCAISNPPGLTIFVR